MNKLKFNPDNAKYYSEEFIKGFECGVERQFNADMAEKTAEWVVKDGIVGVVYCSKCDYELHFNNTNYCPFCGARMKGAE